MFSLFRKDPSAAGPAPSAPLAPLAESAPNFTAEISPAHPVSGPTLEPSRAVDSPLEAARSSEPAIDQATSVEPLDIMRGAHLAGQVKSADQIKSASQASPDAVEPAAIASGGQSPIDAAPDAESLWLDELPETLRVRQQPRPRGKRLSLPTEGAKKRSLTPEQRLLLLDSWRRSGLPAGDFATLVGVSKHTLYGWKRRFDELGPAGLVDQSRGAPRIARLSEVAKRTILMLKESHPEWGCQRISDLLARGPALPVSASTVARVLHEAGYELVDEPTRPHPDKERRFERAKPNQLWQTDLFTFMLKRQNRRVYLVAFMDDHSRFIVSYGLHASCSTALVLEALEAGISSYGSPEEILTDNGPQYVAWRGKSQFTKRLEQRGIRQIVARPKRPQTLGKVERFWGTLWREFLETAVFADLAEARTRVGLFIDYHNFQRVHRGIDGLVPADRFFGAASEVARTLKERVAANALDLARHGQPRAPFYVTGQLEGQAFSVHAEGPRLILTRPGQSRQEVELVGPAAGDAAPAPGAIDGAFSPLPRPVCPAGSPAAELADAPPAQHEDGAAATGESQPPTSANGGDA